MTKKLVVYFSLTGNTKYIAETIAEAVGADLLELIPAQPYPGGFLRYFIGGMQALFSARPALQPFDKNPADYDLWFIGTPVWASKNAAPLNTLLSRVSAEGKKVALYACCGDPSGQALRTMKSKLRGGQVIGELELREPLVNDREGSQQQARAWAQQMIEQA
ncbi:MAG: flavodoxin [Anaerolineae bacterium]|nr:flavodoxin [Anaerolineae bacterium]